MAKITRAIDGFNRYRVSEDGTVFGVGGRPLRSYIDKRGYSWVYLYSEGGKRRCFSVHRLVALSWVLGDTKETVNHKNGDKADNRACNLEWMTNLENMRHSFVEGIRPKSSMGKKKGKTYAIVKEDLLKLFSYIRAGESIRQVAIRSGVNIKTLQYQYKHNGGAL